jgi:hypothetical protein
VSEEGVIFIEEFDHRISDGLCHGAHGLQGLFAQPIFSSRGLDERDFYIGMTVLSPAPEGTHASPGTGKTE